MQTISRSKLEQIRSAENNIPIINVLPPEKFQEEHIPGSINIPADDENFVQKVEQKAGSKSNPVVVYCASTDCDASPNAAKKLEQAGFQNVMDYEEGTKGWREANQPVESGAS